MKRKAKPKAKAKPAPIVTPRPAKAGSIMASLPLGPIKPKPGSMLITKTYKRSKPL